MAKSSLSTNQSPVFLLLYTLAFTAMFSTTAFANPPGYPQAAVDPDKCNTYVEKYRAECPNLTGGELVQCLAPFLALHGCGSGGNASEGACKMASKEWETAKKEFVAACSAAKVPSSGGAAGDIACSAHMRKCTHCDSDADTRPSGVADCGDADMDSVDSDSDTTSDIISQINLAAPTVNSPMQMTPDLNADKRRFSFCPALGAAELKTWQDEYKDAKKIVDDLQTKITKLTEEMDKIKTDAEKKNVELQDKSEDLQTKAKEEAQKATENLEDAQKKMAEDVEKLNEEITKENAQIRQLELGRVQAQTALSDTISRLDLQCHASALQRTEGERVEKLKLMQTSNYSAGDMNALMSGVGLSSRQKNALKVDQYFQFCQRDRAYTMALASAKKALDLALSQADEGKRSVIARIQSLTQKINTIKTSDASKAMQRTYDRLTKIQETMNKELNKLNRERQQAEQNFTRTFQSKAKELQQQQAKLAEEEAYLKQKKNYLAMKTKAAKGIGNTSEEKVNEAMAKYTAVSSAAAQAIKACGCSKTVDKNECVNAKKFMLADNRDDMSLSEPNKSPTPPPTPTVSTPAPPATPAASVAPASAPSGARTPAQQRAPGRASRTQR